MSLLRTERECQIHKAGFNKGFLTGLLIAGLMLCGTLYYVSHGGFGHLP